MGDRPLGVPNSQGPIEEIEGSGKGSRRVDRQRGGLGEERGIERPSSEREQKQHGGGGGG